MNWLNSNVVEISRSAVTGVWGSLSKFWIETSNHDKHLTDYDFIFAVQVEQSAGGNSRTQYPRHVCCSVRHHGCSCGNNSHFALSGKERWQAREDRRSTSVSLWCDVTQNVASSVPPFPFAHFPRCLERKRRMTCEIVIWGVEQRILSWLFQIIQQSFQRYWINNTRSWRNDTDTRFVGNLMNRWHCVVGEPQL